MAKSAVKHHRTMDDLARACGLSRPTLSKFFEDPESVRPGTRKRIEATLAKSDYRPNLFARNLNRKRTRSVGILVPTIADPFYTEMVNRVELALRRDGFWPISMSSHGMVSMEVEAIQTMLALKVAGAIVAPLGPISDKAAFEQLREAAPIVLFDGHVGVDAPYVGNDNGQSVALMVDYLCRMGEPPVYFDIPHVSRNSEERVESYGLAMRNLGHEAVVMGCGSGYSWDFERIGFERMEALLKAGDLPGRTILCANDRLAFGVIAAAAAHGLSVGCREGNDLRVAAHDDHPLSRYANPSLTTMAQDYSGMAARSVELLMSMLDEEENGGIPRARRDENVLLEASLVMRQSA